MFFEACCRLSFFLSKDSHDSNSMYTKLGNVCMNSLFYNQAPNTAVQLWVPFVLIDYNAQSIQKYNKNTLSLFDHCMKNGIKYCKQ